MVDWDKRLISKTGGFNRLFYNYKDIFNLVTKGVFVCCKESEKKKKYEVIFKHYSLLFRYS